VVGGS
jgi:hypothetical protein